VAVEIGAIDPRMRPASEMRVGLDPEAVEEYAQALAEMPPVKLMWDATAGTYWVVDGAHTLTAHVATGQATVRAVVVGKGDYLAAWRAAACENVGHGVRITRADKRSRVERACGTLPGLVEDWPWTASRLAEFCGVSTNFTQPIVDRILEEQGIGADARRTSADGKVRAARRCTSNGHPAPTARFERSNLPPSRRRPYEALTKVTDEILGLISAINAPDDPEARGWGGFESVWGQLSESEQREIDGRLGNLVDSLQRWQRVSRGGRP
jgi:hypothetical protein